MSYAATQHREGDAPRQPARSRTPLLLAGLLGAALVLAAALRARPARATLSLTATGKDSEGTYAACEPGSACDDFMDEYAHAMSGYKATPGYWSTERNAWVSYRPDSVFNDLPPQSHGEPSPANAVLKRLQCVAACYYPGS